MQEIRDGDLGAYCSDCETMHPGPCTDRTRLEGARHKLGKLWKHCESLTTRLQSAEGEIRTLKGYLPTATQVFRAWATVVQLDKNPEEVIKKASEHGA